MLYAELQCVSHFSFLYGVSSCDDLFLQAAESGIAALAIADRNSLAGIVRAHVAAQEYGVRLIVGCRLELTDGAIVLVYPRDRLAYARLCRLLSLGKRRAGKAACHLTWDDVAGYAEGLVGVLVPDMADAVCAAHLRRLSLIFGEGAHLALTLRRRPGDALRLQKLSQLAAQARVRAVATGDVRYHHPRRRILHDVVTCIRTGRTIDDLGFLRERFADRHLKSAPEMHRLFAAYPDALAAGLAIADACRFSLAELTYQYPAEALIPGHTPQQTLVALTWEGARTTYPDGVPDRVAASLRHELALIETMQYAAYFLTVNNIVRYARSRDILCQGRGSAANSAVCFVLGITAIDPTEIDLLFERFISQERQEPPDIDVDFEHERREEVMQFVFETYGRDHAALCAAVVRYRARGALRDVGKALGLTEDLLKSLSSQVWGWSSEEIEPRHVEGLSLNLEDRRVRLTFSLARELINTPRHLSQHSGGFVLTRDRLDELVPIEPATMKDRQVIEWDKDDIEVLKFMKVDCLALGMLTCMKNGFDLLAHHKNLCYTLSTIPAGDARTYEMICRADTLGTFQIESRAQMSMLPRLKPVKFYDLVIQVAIVRPGPIQGDMVHPYLRRRENKEKPEYPSAALEHVLGKTLGVPLFQEQAMRVAIECAGFTPGEADQLRRSMATFKHTGGVVKFREKLVTGMLERGYTAAFAAQITRQLEGFGSYGFPESHAASFARLAYASAWLKCWHPEVFCAALLNAQPMGFYAPAQIVRDAREHGVQIRPICVNASRWDCTLEPLGQDQFAVRLGLRMVKGLTNHAAAELVKHRADQLFVDAGDLHRRAAIATSCLVQLAEADAFRPAFGLERREALWALKALRDDALPLFAAVFACNEPEMTLAPMTAAREVVEDYDIVGLSLRAHPLSFARDDLADRKYLTCAQASAQRDGRSVKLAGLVLVRQRPGTATGVTFITIEDETAFANLVIWSSLFEKQRRLVMSARMLGVEGKIQREGAVVHIIAHRLHDLTEMLAAVGNRETLQVKSRNFR